MPNSANHDDVLLLRAAGTSLLLDTRSGTPRIVHWGADLGPLDAAECAAACDAAVPAVPSSSLDQPRHVALIPERWSGYAGRAALQGEGPGGRWGSRFVADAVTVAEDGDGGTTAIVRVRSWEDALVLVSDLRLSAEGVVSLRHTLINDADGPYRLQSLPAVLPVPARADELLDLTGRHMKERVPQRLPFPRGAWVREQRRGRTGHDAPLLLVAGTAGFASRSGEVWGAHVAWSGQSTTFSERLPEGWSCLGGGELLEPGEIVLDPGAAYSTPWLHAAWSDAGLDGMTARLIAHQRARSSHPTTPRPVVMNTWEAVYFRHDLPTLKRLADLGAGVGAELFVLDDGWFGGRRSDDAGLGDWVVSDEVWPQGLQPIVEHVRALGMRFGLWVEPEMVNLDSDLAREHPEWLLAREGRLPPTARNQHVLDVANPDVFDHLLSRLDALVSEYELAYLKWDHNRDLVDAAHLADAARVPGVHAQTLAVYRLLDELRRRHPGLEIESCAGGGGRADLGVLERTDRVWASDTNDPLERQAIQRWTGALLAPELVGAHVGPPVAHTTGRTASLDFRAGTAMFGHMGIEWDLTAATPQDLTRLSAWVALYKQWRHLLHAGEAVNVDTADPAVRIHGVVSRGRREALFAYVQLDTSLDAPPAPLILAGLDDERRYRVAALAPGDRPLVIGVAPPPWLRDGVVMPGSVLQRVGLPVPPLAPQQLLLMHVAAV